jgi:hypothetical protein
MDLTRSGAKTKTTEFCCEVSITTERNVMYLFHAVAYCRREYESTVNSFIIERSANDMVFLTTGICLTVQGGSISALLYPPSCSNPSSRRGFKSRFVMPPRRATSIRATWDRRHLDRRGRHVAMIQFTPVY